MAPVVTFDLPIFGAGILFGWSLFIVASDLLGLASIDASRLGRFLTVLLLLSIAGGLALLAVHHAPPAPHAAPCRGHTARR
jgi:hypothetical protein